MTLTAVFPLQGQSSRTSSGRLGYRVCRSSQTLSLKSRTMTQRFFLAIIRCHCYICAVNLDSQLRASTFRLAILYLRRALLILIVATWLCNEMVDAIVGFPKVLSIKDTIRALHATLNVSAFCGRVRTFFSGFSLTNTTTNSLARLGFPLGYSLSFFGRGST